MSWNDVCDSVCPVARSLAVVGDRWTLLILRELSMGSRRFDDIQAQTGMSSHLLSTRLKRLEADGVIERQAYSERPPRYEYVVTSMGKELDALLLLLRSWGTKWLPPHEGSGPAVTLTHRETGEEVPDGWHQIYLDDYKGVLSPDFQDERDANLAKFQASKRQAKA